MNKLEKNVLARLASIGRSDAVDRGSLNELSAALVIAIGRRPELATELARCRKREASDKIKKSKVDDAYWEGYRRGKSEGFSNGRKHAARYMYDGPCTAAHSGSWRRVDGVWVVQLDWCDASRPWSKHEDDIRINVHRKDGTTSLKTVEVVKHEGDYYGVPV